MLKSNEKKNVIMKERLHKIFKKRTLIIVGLILVLVFCNPIYKVNPGYYGVKINLITGKINHDILDAGYHFIVPMVEEVYECPGTERIYTISKDYNEYLKGNDTTFWIPTLSNQKVGIDIAFNYSVKSDQIPNLYKYYVKKDINKIESEYLDLVFRNAVISVVSKNELFDVYSKKRERIQQEIFDVLKKNLDPHFFVLNGVTIRNVILTDESEALISAMAKRDAAIIEAEGKSQANRLISESINDKIIQMETINKISDKLKVMVLPNSVDSNIIKDALEDVLTDKK